MDMPAAIDGSTGARDFDGLIGPHIETGYRLAVTLLLDPDEARDAVQVAAIKAWRSLGRLREPEHARAWLLLIVANQCRSTKRRVALGFGRNPLPGAGAQLAEEPVVRAPDLSAAM